MVIDYICRMATFLGSVNGDKETISPALNKKVTNRAFEIMNKTGKKSSQALFNKSFNQAIKEFGYTPSYYHKKMREIGSEFDF